MMDATDKSFSDFTEILFRRKWLILIPLLLCTFVAVYISMGVKPYYISSTLILVEHQKVPESYVTPTDSTPVASRLSTIKQQVMSRTNLEKLIKDFNLYSNEEGNDPNWAVSVIKKIMGVEDTGKNSMEEAIEKMRDEIEVEVIGETKRGGGDAFTISYKGTEPTTIMEVTNTLVSMFIEENLKIREMYAEGTSEFLVSELKKAQEELEVQEMSIRGFKEKNIGALPDQLDTNLRTLDRLQLELQSVRINLRSAQDRKDALAVQLRNYGSSNVVAEAPGSEVLIGANPVEELARLRSLLDRLLSIYTEKYPDVQVVKSNIKRLEEKLAKTNGLARFEKAGEAEDGERAANAPLTTGTQPKLYMEIVAINSQINNYKSRDSQLESQIKAYEKRVEAAPGNEQRLADLTRGYGIVLQNYKSLKAKILDARLAENMEKKQKGERFRVIDSANLPEKPIYFSRYKIIMTGVIGGLGVGAGLVFLLEFLNPAFRKPEDFIGVLEPPVLASIPLYSLKPKGKIERFKIVKGRKGQGA